MCQNVLQSHGEAETRGCRELVRPCHKATRLMTLPLAGVKVVDFSEHGFVPSAAAVLADWGADVVKIERLDGDAMRGIIGSGMVQTIDGVDFLFELVNRNKRGISLEVETEKGREVFER